MTVADRYRAPCAAASGCRQCGRDIRPRCAYCSEACRKTFEQEHFWNTARHEAVRRAGRARGTPPTCAKCHLPCDPEVNHIVPLNGNRPAFGCCHHQTNLEVLCHACHLIVGAEQRRAGLIGRPKPQIALPLGAAC